MPQRCEVIMCAQYSVGGRNSLSERYPQLCGGRSNALVRLQTALADRKRPQDPVPSLSSSVSACHFPTTHFPHTCTHTHTHNLPYRVPPGPSTLLAMHVVQQRLAVPAAVLGSKPSCISQALPNCRCCSPSRCRFFLSQSPHLTLGANLI